MLPTAATDFYATQQQVNETAANEIGRLWRSMGDDFDTSWRRISLGTLAVLTEAQEQVAKAAVTYVPKVLAETDLPDRPHGRFDPDSLVGMASDGRPLESLAYGAVIEAKQAVLAGATEQKALDAGGDWLNLMTKLQIADAARQAVGVMTAMRPNLTGTVRVLNPPSCQRCAILAGRFYKWTTGFKRHPRCDCVNLPAQDAGWAKAEGFLTDPMDAYRKGQIRDLTEAQRFALDQPGADIASIVNATRGMSTTITRRPVKELAKVEIVIRPGGYGDLLAGLRPANPVERLGQLTPEGIYQTAKDRTEAIEMLRHWGYIT